SGLVDEQLEQVNALLATPPPFDPSGSDQLGLFVAGQLAKRHNIKITLRPSPYGGTTAIVLIPQNLVIPEGSHASDPSLPAAAGAALRFQGSQALDWAQPEDDASPGHEPAAPPPGPPAPGPPATARPPPPP